MPKYVQWSRSFPNAECLKELVESHDGKISNRATLVYVESYADVLRFHMSYKTHGDVTKLNAKFCLTDGRWFFPYPYSEESFRSDSPREKFVGGSSPKTHRAWMEQLGHTLYQELIKPYQEGSQR